MNADRQINTYETKKGRCAYLYAQKNSSGYLYETYTKQEHLSEKLWNSKVKIDLKTLF